MKYNGYLALVLIVICAIFTFTCDKGQFGDGVSATVAGQADDDVEECATIRSESVSGKNGSKDVWSPASGTTWQWELNDENINQSFNVTMYDVDLFDVSEETITALKNAGRVVICYFSAGSWENWRDDAADFPESVKGNNMDEWDGEKWLDISNAALEPIMEARLDLAVTKGCDGVEPDNVDGYVNTTGFTLTGAHQIAYNTFLATEAHARNLSVGLKNDVDQLDALVGLFDWALNESCMDWDECDNYDGNFLAANKAVFHVEYIADPWNQTTAEHEAAQVCGVKPALDTLIKSEDLTDDRLACADYCTTNGAACDDGRFCTGTDTCLDGACSVHTGNPCSGLTPYCYCDSPGIDCQCYEEAKVNLLNFAAERSAKGVKLTWKTGQEVECGAFKILRCETAAPGTCELWSHTELDITVPCEDNPMGADYFTVDATAKKDQSYSYYLREYDTTDRIFEYGPLFMAIDDSIMNTGHIEPYESTFDILTAPPSDDNDDEQDEQEPDASAEENDNNGGGCGF